MSQSPISHRLRAKISATALNIIDGRRRIKFTRLREKLSKLFFVEISTEELNKILSVFVENEVIDLVDTTEGDTMIIKLQRVYA